MTLRRAFFALVLVGGLALIASEALGHSQLSTRALAQLRASFTTGGLFGAPRYTTAGLPTCNASNVGAIAFNTTLNDIVVCNGTIWD